MNSHQTHITHRELYLGADITDEWDGGVHLFAFLFGLHGQCGGHGEEIESTISVFTGDGEVEFKERSILGNCNQRNLS